MKSVRIWILLVMAVLLPIRGAVAAAMLCDVAGSGVQSELRLQSGSGGHLEMVQGSAGDHRHDEGHPERGHHDDGSHDHGVLDKCNMCSAFCSLTPFVTEANDLVDPPDLADVRFPDLSTPAPSFVSDGQERPPRTI